MKFFLGLPSLIKIIVVGATVVALTSATFSVVSQSKYACDTAALLVQPTFTRSLATVPPQTITPPSGSSPDTNPLKGWAPGNWAVNLPTTMGYQYVGWSDLEPTEAQYNWSQIDNLFSQIRFVGKRLVIRVYMDYPGQTNKVPAWLVAKGVSMTTYTIKGGGQSPDYDHPETRTAMLRLIAQMGARYDNDERIAAFQAGLLGWWGEWHTYSQPELYADTTTEQLLRDAYKAAFTNRKVLFRYAIDVPSGETWNGFHDDSFPNDTGSTAYQSWQFLPQLQIRGHADNWKYAFIGGEWYPPEKHEWISDASFGGEPNAYTHTKNMLVNGHFSWLGPATVIGATDGFSAEETERAKELARMMGYQFKVSSIQISNAETEGTITARFTIQNEGIAPFYYPWQVKVVVAQGSTIVRTVSTSWDVRNWLPGSSTAEVTFPADAAGSYKIGIGIIDPLTNAAGITFANAQDKIDAWQMLGSYAVSQKATPTAIPTTATPTSTSSSSSTGSSATNSSSTASPNAGSTSGTSESNSENSNPENVAGSGTSSDTTGEPTAGAEESAQPSGDTAVVTTGETYLESQKESLSSIATRVINAVKKSSQPVLKLIGGCSRVY
jgi:hypothetical protein